MNLRSLILCSILLYSCSQTRHYTKVAVDTDVTDKKKAIIAPWVMANFPTETKYINGKTDTVDVIVYDNETMYQLNNIIDSLLLVPKDTLIKFITDSCRKRVKIIKTLKVDTVFIENGAKMYELKKNIFELESDINKVNDEYGKIKENNATLKNQRNIIFCILVGLLLIISAVIYIRFKR